MKVDFRFLLLLACFFLSGLAGLIYETAWTLRFSLVFGTSERALATVLAAYMAGLALGAGAAGRWAHRVRRPVLAYALLELGIAVSALAVPAAIDAASRLHVVLLGSDDLPSQAATPSSPPLPACEYAGVWRAATRPALARPSISCRRCWHRFPDPPICCCGHVSALPRTSRGSRSPRSGKHYRSSRDVRP